MSDANLIILASAILSVFLALGLFVGWCAGRRLSGRRYDYLIYYAAYLLVINIPKLVLAMLGYEYHSVLRLAMDVVEIVLIFLAAKAWSREKTSVYLWLILVPAIVAAAMHQTTGSPTWAMIYGLSFGLILALTIYYISRKAPWYVTATVVLSFGAWIALEVVFHHAGNPVGHAYAMLVKIMLMGSVMFANYERQHRSLWRAAMMRRVAIGIIAGEIGNGDLEVAEKNGGAGRVGLAELCRLASPDRTYG